MYFLFDNAIIFPEKGIGSVILFLRGAGCWICRSYFPVVSFSCSMAALTKALNRGWGLMTVLLYSG